MCVCSRGGREETNVVMSRAFQMDTGLNYLGTSCNPLHHQENKPACRSNRGAKLKLAHCLTYVAKCLHLLWRCKTWSSTHSSSLSSCEMIIYDALVVFRRAYLSSCGIVARILFWVHIDDLTISFILEQQASVIVCQYLEVGAAVTGADLCLPVIERQVGRPR
jgi:hypothetical protein